MHRRHEHERSRPAGRPATTSGGFSDHDPEASAADLTPVMVDVRPEGVVQPKV